MKTPQLNPTLYCQYLLASFDNFTGSHLAEILECSHDAVSDFLRGHSLKPRMLWDQVKPHLPLARRRRGALILDDTVLDKRYSKTIEGTRRQWSGNAKKPIVGIGVVHWLHYDPVAEDFLPVDYRLWDEARDGKSKGDHAREMFLKALQRDFCPDWVLFDAAYAEVKLLKVLDQADLWFLCRIKRNRQVSLPGQVGVYQAIETLEWTEETLSTGQLVWLRAFGWVKVFRIVRRFPDGTQEVQFHLTNRLDIRDLDSVEDALASRWKIEQYHRELKQLTGIERCQARKHRAQRNHIACSILTWVQLWKQAHRGAMTRYQVKKRLLWEYLKHQVMTPTVPVCLMTA